MRKLVEFNREFSKTGKELGMSMLAAVVGLGVMGVFASVMAKQMKNGFRSTAKMKAQMERIEFRRQIAESIDCGKTLVPYQSVPNTIISNSIPKVNLRLANNSIFLPENGKRFGNWFVRATVEPWTNGSSPYRLQVKIAKPVNFNNPFAPPNQGHYRPDPLQGHGGTELNWNHPKSDVFEDVPICNSFFTTGGAWASCPTGKKMIGIDFKRSPICVDKATPVSCGVGQMVNRVLADGTFECGSAFTAMVCSNGQKLSRLNADGTFECGDITANQSCGIGQKQTGVNSDGTIKCGDVNDYAKQCTNGEKVIGIDSKGEAICGTGVTATTCEAGKFAVGITATGEPICQNNLKAGPEGCGSSEIVTGIDTGGKPICGIPPNANKHCGLNEVLKGIDQNGNPICVNNSAAIPALSFSFDENQCNWVQALNCTDCVASCPDGRIARETRVNFSGGGGGSTGNLEVYCCVGKIVLAN